jgi:hypothetical protein
MLAGAPAMQRHAGPRRGARAAGMTSPDGPQRAHASRASHAPRMGPHGPSSADFDKRMHVLPMQRHAGPLRGARAAGPPPPVGPQRARASRAPHGPRMGPHGPSSADFDKRMHVLPMRRHAGPCAASGWPGRALPLAGSGPASAARRMRRAWARMGRCTWRCSQLAAPACLVSVTCVWSGMSPDVKTRDDRLI